jgi:hypothetical protein
MMQSVSVSLRETDLDSKGAQLPHENEDSTAIILRLSHPSVFVRSTHMPETDVRYEQMLKQGEVAS